MRTGKYSFTKKALDIRYHETILKLRESSGDKNIAATRCTRHECVRTCASTSSRLICSSFSIVRRFASIVVLQVSVSLSRCATVLPFQWLCWLQSSPLISRPRSASSSTLKCSASFSFSTLSTSLCSFTH